MASIKLDAAAQLQAVMEPCEVDPALGVKGPVMFAAVLERVTSKEKAKKALVTISYQELLVSNPSGEVTRRLPLGGMNLVSLGQVDHKKQGKLPQVLLRASRDDNEEVDLVLNFVSHERTLSPCNSVDYFVNCVVTAAKVVGGKTLEVVRAEGSVSRNANLRKASSLGVSKTPSFKRQPVPSEVHTEGDSEVGSPSPWIIFRHKATGMHFAALEDGRVVLSTSSPASFRMERHELHENGIQFLHQSGRYLNLVQVPWENSSFIGLSLGEKNNNFVWHLTSQGVLWELRTEIAARPFGNPTDGCFVELSKDAKDTDVPSMAFECVSVGIPSTHLEHLNKQQRAVQPQQPQETPQPSPAGPSRVASVSAQSSSVVEAKPVAEAAPNRIERKQSEQAPVRAEKQERQREIQLRGEELKKIELREKQRKEAQAKYDEEVKNLMAEIEAEKENELRDLMEERDKLRVANEKREKERNRETVMARSIVSCHSEVSTPSDKKSRQDPVRAEGTSKNDDKESDIPHRSVTNMTPVQSDGGFSTSSRGAQTREERESMLCYGYQRFYHKHDAARVGQASADAKKAAKNEAKSYRELLQKYPSCPIKDADFLRPDAVGDIKREVKYLRELIQDMKPLKEGGKPVAKDNKYLISLGVEKQDAPTPWNAKKQPRSTGVPAPAPAPAPAPVQQEVAGSQWRALPPPVYHSTFSPVSYLDAQFGEQNTRNPATGFGTGPAGTQVLPPEAIRWTSPHVFASSSAQAPSFAQPQDTATQTPQRTAPHPLPLSIQKTTQQTQAPSECPSVLPSNPPSYITVGGTLPAEQPEKPGTWRPKDWTYIDRSDKGTEVM